MTDFSLVRGDSRVLDVEAKQPPPNESLAQPLTGVDLWWTAKAHFADEDSASVIPMKGIGTGITVTNAVGGICEIAIAEADWVAYTGSGPLYWALRARDGAGFVTTLDMGILTIRRT
jgi:hypothetical protein